MKMLGKLMVAGVLIFALLQVGRPAIPAKPATAELQAPAAVKQVLEKNCYSCHSDQRRLSWFDEIVPGYWLVRYDILTAREHLNFSTLGAKPAAAQKGTLYEAVNMIQLGAMPLPRFLKLHPEARVTPDELTTLKEYLAPWTPALQPAVTPAASPEPMNLAPVNLMTVQPELNGLPFDPNFETWKPLSFTDRGDNGTFRFILGNSVAVKAAQSGNISPWPDGARFAKVTWQQEMRPDGLVYPGKFIQVELMVKNAGDYKDTEGWGWGRWRGVDLKPYGNDAQFVNECTGCHQPMRGDDYVYTMPISAAKVGGQEVVNSAAAALPVRLPYQPLRWGAVTMFVDPGTHTMATLYGNDVAMLALEARRTGGAYPAGSVLALVTWAQRDDPHWFGARIPDRPLSVEFVLAGSEEPVYQRFAGPGLTSDQGAADAAAERTRFVLGLAPAPLP
jgi:mono/diheme cytochrome c family protein